MNSNKKEIFWERINGEQLIESYEECGNLDSILPTTECVYMWKLNLTYAGINYNDPDPILKRLEELLTKPQGVVKSIEHHSVDIEVRLKGKGLKNKYNIIEKIANQGNTSMWLVDFLSNLNQHMPSLYVGQTSNLNKRIQDHINNSSGFSEVLLNSNTYKMEELTLFYLKMNNADQQTREAIEHIVTILTIATYTRRIG